MAMATNFISAGGLVLGLALLTPTARCDDKSVENAKARLEAARKTYRGMIERAKVDPNANADPERLYLWSRRWMEAERELATKAEEKVAAVEAHLDRMKTREAFVRKMIEKGFASPVDLAAQEFYRLEAEQWLAQLKGK
jgi:hypothetical protein